MDQSSWQKVLAQIKQEVSPGNFRTWFSQASLESLQGNKIILSVPSAFIKGQLVARYDQQIKKAAKTVLGEDFEIEYLVDPSKSLKTVAHTPPEDVFHYEQNSFSQKGASSPLNPKYTLQNFVVGLTNNLAYAAAQAVSQTPGTSYNPLFIYGPSGVGKTHLMQAIGNALLSKNPYLKIVYAPSERFMNDFVESIQTKSTGSFRQKYRSCNILLIDDIQFIQGKDSTQEEFFHTFNELHSKNSQLVFTSDRPPHEIQKLESRLASRFQGGLMVDIQLPDFDTRVAIIKAKLREKQETLDEDIIRSIAENSESNTREIEGKLIQFLQVSKLTNQPINPALIAKILGRSQATQNSKMDYKKLLSTITGYFNVRLSDLTGPRRQKEFVLPRQIAMFLMYEESRLPMEKIGDILGGRDHTTVLHGIEKIRLAQNRDREIQRLLIEVRQATSA